MIRLAVDLEGAAGVDPGEPAPFFTARTEAGDEDGGMGQRALCGDRSSLGQCRGGCRGALELGK